MGIRTAADIMTPDPKMLSSTESLQEVVRYFLDHHIKSSPVIHPNGEILGILTEFSLVKAYMAHKGKFNLSHQVGHHTELLDPVSYIGYDANLFTILNQMIEAPTHRLLVRDIHKKVIGIICPRDLMTIMVGDLQSTHNLQDRLKESEYLLRQSLTKIEQLERHYEVYSQVFHEIPYMMHAVDENGIIIMANKREHKVLGFADGELVGKSIFELYSPSVHGEAKRGLKTVIETGKHSVTYTTLIRKDGTPIKCDIASSALRDENGKFLSTISVLRPIDTEELLRALNGIVNDERGPLAQYVFSKDSNKKT